MSRARLLPQPRRYRAGTGRFSLRATVPIVLRQADDDGLRSAMALRTAIEKRAGISLPIETHARADDLGPRIELRCESDRGQRYHLQVRTRSVDVTGSGPAGLRYGVETLKQLLRPSSKSLPAVDIQDEPDLERRGLLIDISRGKVPKVKTLENLMDLMVQLKLNLLMLYTEHTFRFRRHPGIGEGASPLDAEDVLRLDAYAAERHIELVPTLQSLGHMHHVLGIRRYRHLAESEKRWSLSPAVPETYGLLEDLYSEYLPNFRSSWFNANCDEPVDLGKGRSRAWAERRGRGAVFRTHLERVQALASKFSKRTMFWGDVVHEHPEQIPLLSKKMMLLDWWYEADHDFDRVKVFAEHRLPFMVCAGTASWNTLFPRGDNALANIEGHARAGKRYGAGGLIVTDWGDNGHYNLLGNSLFGFAWGAQTAWGRVSVDAAAFDRAFSLQVFDDPSGTAGRIYRTLGGLHDTGFVHFNNSPLKSLYFDRASPGEFLPRVDPKVLERTWKGLQKVEASLRSGRGALAARPVARDELAFAVDASILAAEKGLARKSGKRLAREQRALKRRHKELWLARNRRSNFEITAKLYDRSIRSLERL